MWQRMAPGEQSSALLLGDKDDAIQRGQAAPSGVEDAAPDSTRAYTGVSRTCCTAGKVCIAAILAVPRFRVVPS